MTVNIIVGDVRDSLKTLDDKSVHCIVTSPPYWGLRDYGTGKWVGGDPHCNHVGKMLVGGKVRGPQTIKTGRQHAPAPEFGPGRVCKLCGAERDGDKQIGSEADLASWIKTMVSLGRELWRVLRDDGTFWLNVGDSYTGGPKQKDLAGQPWALAFALREAGWFLRSACVWHKPNCLPESVTDRPTINHEYMFMLTKRPSYFYDAAAVRTNYAASTYGQAGYMGESTKDHAAAGVQDASALKKRLGAKMPRNRDLRKEPGADVGKEAHASGTRTGKNPSQAYKDVDMAVFGANLRSVWSISPQPLKLAHFATFPERLVEPCVRAGTSEHGCCRKCGAPYQRIEKVHGSSGKSWHDHGNDAVAGAGQKAGGQPADYRRETLGWEPTCEHRHLVGTAVVPCTVLDPFSGSGTTGVVARWLGRNYIGCELNPKYAEMSRERIATRSSKMQEDAKARPDKEARICAIAAPYADDPGPVGALARLALELHGGGSVSAIINPRGFRGEHGGGTHGYVNQGGPGARNS